MRKVGPFYQEAIPIFSFWPCEDENDHDESHKLIPIFSQFCYVVFIACVRGVLPLLCVLGRFLLSEFSFHFIFFNWLIQIYNFIFSLSYK